MWQSVALAGCCKGWTEGQSCRASLNGFARVTDAPSSTALGWCVLQMLCRSQKKRRPLVAASFDAKGAAALVSYTGN